jgi:hypothetical protein
MLRKRSKGVAEKSQHMLGKAMDFYVPGVKIKTLRNAALKVQGGGVGYYPKSGSPFVHVDVGNVRHWPRLSRQELASVFPDGKTMHVPTDGKPLPGYKQALAAYQARKKNGGSIQMASASGGGFLSKIFGGGADEEEDSSEVAMASPMMNDAMRTASRSQARTGSREAAAAPERAQAPEPPAAVQPEPETPETIIAALPARGVPQPLFAPRPEAEVGAASEMAGGFDTGAAGPDGAQADENVEVALNIPLPSRRPDYEPPVELTPEGADQAAVLAAIQASDTVAEAVAKAEGKTGAMAIAEILADDQSATLGTKLAALAPSPESRPDWPAQANAYAAIPESRPGEAAAASAPQQIALAAGQAKFAGKGGRLAAAAASPRLAMLKSGEGASPTLALGTGVKTAPKSPRPSRRDAEPAPRVVVKPLEQESARWALTIREVAELRSASEPARAHDAIRSAPEAVYTVGFTQDEAMADPNRFTGEAVRFMSIAKFETN